MTDIEPKDPTYSVVSAALGRLEAVAQLIEAARLALDSIEGEYDSACVARLLGVIVGEVELVKEGVKTGADVLHVLAYPHKYPNSPYTRLGREAARVEA
jgi:hypothetical protein